MSFIFGFFFLGLSLPLALTRCICNRHVERSLYGCPKENQAPVGYMYANDLDDPCLPVAKYANPPLGWGSVIYRQSVAYLQLDYNAYEDPNNACEEPPDDALISTDPDCHIPAYDPTTTRAPTTPRMTTLWTVPTRRPTVQTTQPTARPTILIPVIPQTSVSTKCDHLQVLKFMMSKFPAIDPSARQCYDGSNAREEALIYASCKGATVIDTWIKEKQVITNCNSIPKGEPIGMFRGPQSLGIAAIFWECTATSFTIAHQECGPVEIVDVETKHYPKELFFTFSW